MRITKAVLTGGGRATRLYPITTTINKHLLPLANKPMIFHAIETVVAAGITEIFINTNPGEKELQKYIGDGGHWGISVTFFEQSGGPQGIAHVVNEARQFIGDDSFLFYLSDNIFLGGVEDMLAEFEHGAYDCMLALATVPDPERFGVPIFDAENNLIEVREKPENPPNNFAVTGIYVYAPKIFFEAFQKLEKSSRGEYEISDIHSSFLREGRRVGVKEISGYWKDTGKPGDLLHANQLLLDHMPECDFVRDTQNDDNSITGKVHIGLGARLGSHVKIIGPAIIGENCILDSCTIGPYVSLGTGAEVYGAAIRDSMILDHAVIQGNMRIERSIIGKHAQAKKQTESAPVSMIIGDKTMLWF